MKVKLKMNCFKFHLACSQKLEEKEKEGFDGYYKPENKKQLEVELLKHTVKGFSPDNLIDISNYCNFLWNLDEDAKAKTLKTFADRNVEELRKGTK